MPCHIVIPIENTEKGLVTTEEEKFNLKLVFYNDQGWSKFPGRQVHLTLTNKNLLTDFMYDNHIINYKFEWIELMSMLKYSLENEGRLKLSKIKHQRGAFTAKHCPGSGIDLQFDHGDAYHHINSKEIKKILSYEDQITKLFENGLENNECNCWAWTSPYFVGPCYLKIKDLNAISCVHCESSAWCCEEYFGKTTGRGAFWRFTLEPLHAHHKHPHAIDWSPTNSK